MILPLLAAASLPKDRVRVDHTPLVGAYSTTAAIVSPAEELWAVARLVAVGESRPRELTVEGVGRGTSFVFDVDLDVLDGWNVAPGRRRAFWAEGSTGTRQVTVRAMIGRPVLVRIAPVRDGHYQLVGGTNEQPELDPTYDARAGEDYVSILLPYPDAKLGTGDPAWRAWTTVWRAATMLDPRAYDGFLRYIGGIRPPLTPPWTGEPRKDAGGKILDHKLSPRADAEWLLRLSTSQSPGFQMMVAAYLRSWYVAGSTALERELVLLALRQPDLFPNGLFRVANYRDLNDDLPSGLTPGIRSKVWSPRSNVLERLDDLAYDLLQLLVYYDAETFVPNRARLLPLLRSSRSTSPSITTQLFDKWQGAVPKGTDPSRGTRRGRS